VQPAVAVIHSLIKLTDNIAYYFPGNVSQTVPAAQMLENQFFRSLKLLNTLLIFVVTLFFIDAIYSRSMYLNYFWLGIFFSVPLKIYCHAGIYGYLTEIVSGQEVVISFSQFHANAKKYAIFYALILAFLYGLHFVIYLLVPTLRVVGSFKYFYPFVGILASFVVANYMIKDKYEQAFKLTPKKLEFTFKQAGVLFILFITECLLSWLPIFVSVHSFDWTRFSTLALKYLYLLEYIYICQLIFNNYKEITNRFKKSHQIYLINPCSAGIIDGIAFQFQLSYPPFFVVLKALTPKSYSFREFNRIFWRDRYYSDGKLVAISCFTSNCAEAYKIAKEFRRHGSKVVMGGPHVTYLPDEALKFCDSVVIGEAEGVWKDVVRDFENDNLKPKYMGEAVEDYYKEVHKELLISPPHVIRDFLETTRGCKFRCHFCTIPSLSGGRTRKKPVEEIVELIQKIKHKYNKVLFIDNNIYSDPAYAKKLFEALIPLKIKWRTQCTIDIAKNTETLALAKKSGCDFFLFGYEIFGGSLEKQQGGKFAMAENYIRYTNIIKKMGIKIKAHFIFGFDSDRLGNLSKLWKFCFSIWPSWTILSMLTPLPGSRLYHDMLQEKRIINLNWRNYAMHNLVIKHPFMNPRIASFIFPFIRTSFLMTTSSGGLVLLGVIIAVLFNEIFMRPAGVNLF
jgi:radical SAM superfamily enzyme YgiQ (UPF0313 family)